MAEKTNPSARTDTATFAAGCFWGVEEAFRGLGGVVATRVGYTGGHAANPTYEEVCTGRTGHAEAVRVVYDPEVITYDDLLEAFWKSHDPTTPNRQGPDVGAQYRSAIFVHNDDQRQAAEASREKGQRRLDRPIVTEIVEAGPFYEAEAYHQQYLAKRGMNVCH